MLRTGLGRWGRYLATSSALVLAACGGGDGGEAAVPPGKPVEFAAKVSACGTGDKPEAALQGQVPAAQRQAGFTGTHCNLELVGQVQGEGGNWSAAAFRDASGHTCAYHATGVLGNVLTGAPLVREHPGVPVIDITDPAKPVRVTSLTTAAMLDPWESLRVNSQRQLLVADNGTNSTGGPEIDVYDLSGDCRSPQLLASLAMEYKTGDASAPTKPINGHEGNISPDGLTYYVGDPTNLKYHAIDITIPTRPRLIATFDMSKDSPIGKTPHGLSVSPDGNRLYAAALGVPSAAEVADPNAVPQNGFLVIDTSEVQARKPDAQMHLVSQTAYRDGSAAQHTIETRIGGKPYLVMVDEGGSGGLSDAVGVANACKAGLALFPMARIYDMTDEKHPVLVSKLGLETHDPKNCDSILPDLAGLSLFTYGSHYCSVDSRENATAMACSYFNSGIRVFDIRNPAQPREIAYFNPPSAAKYMPASFHAAFGQWKTGEPDWCTSGLDFDKARGLLTTMCQDNGLLVMKFKNGVWPFPETTESALHN